MMTAVGLLAYGAKPLVSQMGSNHMEADFNVLNSS